MEQKIFYDSTDGVKLCGLLSRVNDNNKIVVLCHGLNGNKTERNSFNPFVEKLQKQNINSFRFDFRGHGESTGNDFEMTPTKEVEDLEKTIEHLNSIGFNEIVLLGASFGGSIISLLDYNKYNCVKALICWYGCLDYFYTIEAEGFFSKEHRDIAEKNGWFEVTSKRTGRVFRLGKTLYDEVYKIVPYESLIKVELPILFVHGLIDNMVPYESSVKVSKMCKNAKLELIENGSHTFDNDVNALNKAIDVSIDFIKSILN
jgi:pimeloyl-ACP methyl ester carboxylesterase